MGEKRREVTLISGLKCLELISPREEKQLHLIDCTVRPAFRSTVLPKGSHRDLPRLAFPEFRWEAALPTTCQQPENHVTNAVASWSWASVHRSEGMSS